MQNLIFISLSVFFSAHTYRDYLHSKGIHNTWFTRVAHWWDAPQYEKHGMVGSALLAVTFLVFAIK